MTEVIRRCIICSSQRGTSVDGGKNEEWYWPTEPFFAGPLCSDRCGMTWNNWPLVRKLHELFGDDAEKQLTDLKHAHTEDGEQAAFIPHWSRCSIVPHHAHVHLSDMGSVPRIANDPDAAWVLSLAPMGEPDAECSSAA